MWLNLFLRILALIVTNCIKVAGLYVGVRAAVAPTPNAVVLAFAAFMMAGAQMSETTAMAFVERFFTGSVKPKEAPNDRPG